MTTKDDATDLLRYKNQLHQIRTNLAGVMSVLSDYEINNSAGSLGNSELIADSEYYLQQQEENLEEMKEKVVGENGVVSVLKNMKEPEVSSE